MTNGIQSCAATWASPDLPDILTGQSERHLIFLPELQTQVHVEAAAALLTLAEAAGDAGFDLRVASSFRSFDRQSAIWNGKANGQRIVLDANGRPIDMAALDDRTKLYAILQWSALPGASRHHWGTDLDVFDASRMAPGYQIQLTQSETEADGPFAEFHHWLTSELAQASQDFFRPYVAGLGSISPEPWHLSYAPVANIYAAHLTQDLLAEKIVQADIALKPVILDNLSDIFNRYVKPYQYNHDNKMGDACE